MEPILLKLIDAGGTYRGTFADYIFESFAAPEAIYRALLKHLRKYGVTLTDLNSDMTRLSDANISCFLSKLSTFIFIRLERLDMSFSNLHENGADIVSQILLDSCTALQEAQALGKIVEHHVDLNIVANIQDASYDTVLRQYVTLPKAFGEHTLTGLAFYIPENAAQGARYGSLVLNHVPGQEHQLTLRANMIFDGTQIPVQTLAPQVKTFITHTLHSLGLAFTKENTP